MRVKGVLLFKKKIKSLYSIVALFLYYAAVNALMWVLNTY